MFYKPVVVFIGLFFYPVVVWQSRFTGSGVVAKINSELFRFKAKENEVYGLHLTVLNTPQTPLGS